jgi:Domain of unknown function (DUF4249)
MNKLNIMKNILVIALVIVFASCEKIIQVDLNSSDPQIIVEAVMSDTISEKAEVRLSRSVNFSETNTFPAVANAAVTITDLTDNKIDTLKESVAGLYKSSKLSGQEGHSYLLTVKTDGKTLTSTAAIPRKVKLDSIEVRGQPFFGSINYQIIPKYIDPKGIGDNYRFVMYVNGKRQDDIFVFTDELSDGNPNGRPLQRGRSSDSTENIKIGDRIDLEMHGVDKGVYEYFNTLRARGGGGPGGGSATPANPITNIKGGALGYFAAYTKQRKSAVVK